MAVSKAEIVNFLQANPNMSDADIASAMAQYGVSPAQMAAATGLPLNEVNSRLSAVGMFAPQTQPTRVVPTARGTVIEGDNIDAQIAGLPQVVYETKVDPKNTANWQTINPKTGEVIDSGTFAGGGDKGLLAAAAPIIGLAASTVGLPSITGLIGGLTGATGSTLAGLTGAAISGGTSALSGNSTQDILKASLTGGLGAYGGSVLRNLDVPVDFTNMTADELDDALKQNFVKDLKNAGVKNTNEFITNQGGNAATYIQESVAATDLATNLANQGLNNSEIAQLLESSGVSSTAIADALDSLPVNTGGLLSSVVTTPTSTLPVTTAADAVNITSTTPSVLDTGGLLGSLVPATTVTKGGTVEVAGNKVPEQVDKSVLDLINSQLDTNVTTPANLANVEITGNRGMMSGDTSVTDIISLLAGATPPPTAPTTRTSTVNVVGEKPKEPTIIDKLIIEPKPPVEPTQKPVIEPKPPLDEVVIKGERPTITIEDILGVLTNTVAPTTSTPTVNVVGQRPIEPTIIDKPIIEPKPPVDEVVIKDNKPTITIEDILSVLTNTLPTPPTTLPEVVIKDQKPVPPLLPPIIVEPPQKPIIEPLRPVEPTIIDKPIIEPNTPVKPTIAEQVITGDRTINLNNLLSTLVAPVTLTPTVKVVDKKPVEPTIVDKPIIEPKPPVEPDPLKVIQDTAKIVNLLNTDTGTNQTVTTTDTGFPIVPIPADWTNPSATGVAPFTPLSPIDFGTRELLRGTQWEKFLSPTYGQVPEPVKFLQPSNMSYNDLMTILNGNQTPSRSNLSINDIISGIQNQYGQTPTSTMG